MKYIYKYHDGVETLRVKLLGDEGKESLPHQDSRILNTFRQTFGIPPSSTPASVVPTTKGEL